MRSLTQLLEKLGIDDGWSLFLIGDGSGSNWDKPCGFACVSIENDKEKTRQVWFGANNRGTVGTAEISAYLSPLNWFACREEAKPFQERKPVYHIHVLTDSQYVAATGQDIRRMVTQSQFKNACLWAAYELLPRRGFILHWHWMPRASTALNKYVDRISREARRRYDRRNLQEIDAENVGYAVHDCNPSV